MEFRIGVLVPGQPGTRTRSTIYLVICGTIILSLSEMRRENLLNVLTSFRDGCV